MRILITNDDGINAPGLKHLITAARELSDDITVVAPETNQSGVSHAMTLKSPLRLMEVADNQYAVNGTPTDCVIVAVRQLLSAPPDLVLSGINAGQNVADHITYSGTVAGAMEGALLGIPSIALSQTHDWSEPSAPLDWSVAKEQTAAVVTKLLDLDLPHNTFLNVNFPIRLDDETHPYMITRQAQRMHGMHIDERIDGGGQPYYWLKFEDGAHEACETTDLAALALNKISISPIKVDMTDHSFSKALEKALI